MNETKRKFVLVIPDGAADMYRSFGRSPIGLARTPAADFLARSGVSGRMRTLYDDLPKESLVAQLGMLGWDPRVYYPHGRASCELLALEDVRLGERDLAFRANFVRVANGALDSYNADYLRSEVAAPLVARLNAALASQFPEFELYHNADFRNTLVVREAGAGPESLVCREPHESQGSAYAPDLLVVGRDANGEALAARVAAYLERSAELLRDEPANMLSPWSASRRFGLPSFAEHTGFDGRAAIVACMDFLHGVAKAGEIDFFKTGNGRPDTDYAAKGRRVVELLGDGYELVVCHVNGPDEASHMGDAGLKIRSLEMIDRFVVRPVVEYFRRRPDELGGVAIVPDHYTNCGAVSCGSRRVEVHSADPVPFVLWNGVEVDQVETFCEDEAARGAYGAEPVHHLDLLRILGSRTKQFAQTRAAGDGHA